MPGIPVNPEKRAATKYRYDRISSYPAVTPTRVPPVSDRIVVIHQGSNGWTVPTTAFALVVIALATLVGGGMTTWHYWNVECRAAEAQQQAAQQRHMDLWKTELQRADAARQQHFQLIASRREAWSHGFVTPLPAAQEQEKTESLGSSAGLVLLSGSNTAAVDVPVGR
jgi:hypothetical protein